MDAQPLPSAEPPPVRVSDPGEIAAALPHLLGFRPRESVVLVGMTDGPGSLVELCVRADIPPPGLVGPVAGGLAAAVATSEPSGVVVAVVSDAPDGPLLDDPERLETFGLRDAVDLPHRDLVHELVLALDAAGIAVPAALLVRAERWWSYDCPHSCCAPGAGTPLPAGPSALAAASVVAGQVLAGDRSELLARIAPPDGAAAAAMADVCLRVGHAWAGPATAGGDEQSDAGWAAVVDGLAAVRPGPSSRRLGDEEVARIGWGLRDLDIRDRALELALGPDADAAAALWTECTRRCPTPLDAAPATLLAVSAWLRGSGAMANIALDRALGSDPEYSLARLLDKALAACVPPAGLRSMLLAAVADARRAG